MMHNHVNSLQVFCIVISAFRTELYFALNGGNRDLPVLICLYSEDDIYGDRICNNAVAASVTSILVAIVLLLIDLQIPCLSSKVGILL